MNKRKYLVALLSITSITSLIGVVSLNTDFGSLLFHRVSADRTYSLTLRASDLVNNFVTSNGGARLEFEHSGVSSVNDELSISKNGYIRFTVPINGTTSLSINVPSFSDSDKLMVSSGYNYNDYGAACYLTKSNNTTDTYYRTYFQFSSDSDTISVGSITINYTCSVHYNFTPIMNSVTENVSYGSPQNKYEYSGLVYENNIEPDLSEVDIVKERFDLDLSMATDPDPAYSIHPIAKFYDKGGCLIKQAEGFWLCHVNPIIRFFIAKNRFESFTFTYGDTFDLSDNSPLYNGILSGFDWSEYTKDGGALRNTLTQSMDLYPKVIMNVNPGAYAIEESYSREFTPNPNEVNFGFPTINNPTLTTEHFNFAGWVNGEEIYDPTTAVDFHDYDLYAKYNSDYDLRLKFQNRGFNNAYLEIGVPDGTSIAMPGTDTYVDQSTIGLAMGKYFKLNEGTGNYEVLSNAYLVYPQGHRDEAVIYEAGESFINDGKGTLDNPATYIAEPYVEWAPKEMFSYLQFGDFYPLGKGLVGSMITKHFEHMYYDGINDVRTYFKKIVLPDSLYTGSGFITPYSTPYGNRAIIDCDLDDRYDGRTQTGIGITDSIELEVVVGNDYFQRLYGSSSSNGYSFKNNAELRRLEYFPSLTEITKYTFWGCSKLEPLQNWPDIGPIDEIDEHAFDLCFVNPIIDVGGNISRRRFELPSTLRHLGNYVFAKAVYTDFYIDGDGLSTLSLNSFAYSDDNSHSDDFANMLTKYNQGTADVAAIKAVANHVIFDGSEAEFEALVGTYNELDVLLNKEYYVTFTK